ncbi:SulP family inorganic anion transporter [bacterium]|nr:SulP family inorganic anion transporter [bacterium]
MERETQGPLEFSSAREGTLKTVFTALRAALREVSPQENIRLLSTNVVQDLMAGVVVAVIALPLALAFGVGSGLGAVAGLWGAVAGGVVGGFFSGSRVSVSGPTGPTMVQLAAVMVGFRLASGEPDLSAAFSIVFLSGVLLVGFSFLQLSKLIYFTPYSVVSGFMCGIGVIVMLLQVNPFVGLESPSSVMSALTGIPYAVTHADNATLLVAVSTLAVLVGWPMLGRILPVARRIPATLVGVLVGSLLANGLNLSVAFIGEIPSELPHLYVPDISRFPEFLVPAASLAGLVILDSLLTCIISDNMIGERHSSDRETWSQGLSNMTAGLIGGLPTSTATMGTVANIRSGGRTPLASMTHGILIGAVILGLGSLAEHIPMAALAAILLKVGFDILDYRILPVLHRLPATDMLVFWTVLTVTVVQDLLSAMGVGIVLAFFRFVQEVSRVYTHEVVYLDDVESYLLADELEKKIKVLKPQGPLFFGSIETLDCVYESDDSHDDLVIDLARVPMIDLSGAYALEDLILRAKEKEKEVFLCNARPEVEDILRRTEVIAHVGEECFFHLSEEAIIEAQEIELVKLTHREMIRRSVGNVEEGVDRHRLSQAAAYAHEAVYREELRVYYGDGSHQEIFCRAVEDYLVQPEIVEIAGENFHGHVGDTISCEVRNNYDVASVRFTLLTKEGAILESGEAVLHELSRWVYTAQKAVEELSEISVRVDAVDRPGNTTQQEVQIGVS